MWACPFGRVEGKNVRCRIAVCKSGDRIHEPFGEVFDFSTVLVHNHQDTFTLFHGHLDAFSQSFIFFVLNSKFVDDYFDVVVLVSINFHSAHNLLYLTVYAYVEITLSAHTLKKFAIVAFPLTDKWGEEVDTLAHIVIENHVNDLFFGIFHHFLSAHIAVGRTRPCIQQAQVVIHLCRGSDSRTGIFVGCLLFDADNRTQSCNLVHVRSFHVA